MTDTTDRTFASSASGASAGSRYDHRLRSNNFDGLRLVFAGMVVVFHISLLSEAPALRFLHTHISSLLAVQCFFFVSGFLVTMSFERTQSLLDYAKKRFFRIAPAYVTVVVLAAVLLVFVSSLSPQEYYSSPRWRSYLLSNLMLSNFAHPALPGVFQGHYEPTVNGSLWTIKVEVMFYCTVPFIVLAVRRFGYRTLLLSVFVASILWHVTLLGLSGSDTDIYAKLAKQLPGQLSFFAGGALAYYRTRDNLPPPPLWMAVAAVGVFWLADGLVAVAIAPVCVTVMVYWAAIRVRELWNARATGDLSYGIYLYHFPIAQTLISLGLFGTYPLAAFGLACALTLATALLSWHIIEKPALRFAHRPAAKGAAT